MLENKSQLGCAAQGVDSMGGEESTAGQMIARTEGSEPFMGVTRATWHETSRSDYEVREVRWTTDDDTATSRLGLLGRMHLDCAPRPVHANPLRHRGPGQACHQRGIGGASVRCRVCRDRSAAL